MDEAIAAPLGCLAWNDVLTVSSVVNVRRFWNDVLSYDIYSLYPMGVSKMSWAEKIGFSRFEL
jgi:hypothetical protein